jgi:methylamine---glutamate N-methyltransferase subunit B
MDLSQTPRREVNAILHGLRPGANESLRILNPRGCHALAAGIDAPVNVEVDGHVGYYCAGMNKLATVVIHGNAGPGLAENIMSGRVEVRGDASQAAGATGQGGLIVIGGNASARCGISMKGVDIVVRGSVGHMSAFMAQAGRLVVLGDAGDALGDSLYEARLYVRGVVKSLGADCVEKPMRAEHKAELAALLEQADLGGEARPDEFRRYGSARTLYHFRIDNAGVY